MNDVFCRVLHGRADRNPMRPADLAGFFGRVLHGRADRNIDDGYKLYTKAGRVLHGRADRNHASMADYRGWVVASSTGARIETRPIG